MADSAAFPDAPPLADQYDDRPFARAAVVLSKLEYIELRSQLNFFKTQHERALVREAELKRQLQQERAKVGDLNAWMFGWVEAIGELYHLNKLRLPHWAEEKPLGRQSKVFQRHHRALRQHLSQMKARSEAACSRGTFTTRNGRS